jgi:hypothetical protein
MARSVSIPSGALGVTFASFMRDSEEDVSFEFSKCIVEMQLCLMAKYPSLEPCSLWIGREDCAYLQNRFCSIGISEYNGLVAVWILPDEESNLAAIWCGRVDLNSAAECFGPRLNRMATFSSGEAFFQPADGQQRGPLGLGFTSQEGWL